MTRRGVVLGLLAVAGCRRKRQTPEDRVRALIEKVETAVEEKDLDPIKAALSEKYRDDHEGDRRAVIGMMQVMFLRHPSIHLLVRVKSVETVAPGQVRAELLAAMASVPVSGPEELPRVNADLYQFTVTFAEEEPEVFRVVTASWERARLESFF